MQPEMTMRDHFAAAALTGLLSNVQRYQNEPLTRQAFEIADFMLGERERTNHDAAPAARAVSDEDRTDKAATSHRRDRPGDTPVTEPMPKEKRAEGSAEPVAWGVEDDRGLQYALHPTPGHASHMARTASVGLGQVVPLYRHRQPTLTDEEREAVEHFAVIDGPQYLPQTTGAAATLRGLLERLG